MYVAIAQPVYFVMHATNLYLSFCMGRLNGKFSATNVMLQSLLTCLMEKLVVHNYAHLV